MSATLAVSLLSRLVSGSSAGKKPAVLAFLHRARRVEEDVDELLSLVSLPEEKDVLVSG